MPENWPAIAAEVADAIASVGFTAELHEPEPGIGGTDADPNEMFQTVHFVTVIDDNIRVRDASGLVTGTKRVLTIGATGVIPVKGWHVVIGCTKHRIAAVTSLAPGGTAVLYDVELAG
jgi:hypothetical protein